MDERRLKFIVSLILLIYIILWPRFLIAAAKCYDGYDVISEGRTPANCAVPQYEGVDPSKDEIITIFEQAGNDLLGDKGPPLPEIGSGCSNKILSKYCPFCPLFEMVSPFVPPYLLRIIGYVESGWKQFYLDKSDNKSKTVVSEAGDCGFGIMQITTRMQCRDPIPSSYDRDRVAYDWIYNIGTGALFLIEKWNSLHYYIGENNPSVLDDWYYAVWAYNSGQKDVKASGVNNPNNPLYLEDRPSADSDGFDPKHYSYPYQEFVWGYANNPPPVKDGNPGWERINLTLPDPNLFKDKIPQWISRPTTQLPNLSPYQPSNWSDKIVIFNSKDTNTDSSPLYTTDTLYVDWAVVNGGPVPTPQGFSVALYIDGVLKKTWSLKACLNSNGYWPIEDYSIGKLSEGNHTLKIVADSTGVIQETDEGDNEYTKTITVINCTFTLTAKPNPSKAGTVTKSLDKPKYCSGEVVTFTATPNPGYSFKSWTGVDSSEGSTATVTMNKKRTVKANFIKASTTLSIVTVTPSSWTFTSPGTKQLTATANCSDNSTEDVTTKATWTSSNPNVATANNSGLVTSGQNGSAVITASYGGKSGTCTVTVDIINETYVIKIGAEADSIHFHSQRKLAVTSDGHLHVVYHSKDRSGILQIYHAESADGGRTWVEEQLTQAPKDQWFPALAVDSKDNLHLVWQDDAIKPGTVPSTYYKKKTTDWQVAEFVASYATTPAIAIDSNDDVHVVYGVYVYPPGYYGGGNGIRWRKRTSSGWQPEESISSEKYWAEVPAVAIDGNNNIHVVWSHAPRAYYYDIHYRVKTFSGWGSEVEINTETTNEIGPIPSIAIDGKNFVHVVWHHESGGYYTIKYRKYTSSWEPTEDLDTTPYQQYEPTIALDSKDHIHAVWSGQHSASPTHFQIRYREYTTSWQPIENLTSSISSDQTNPSLLWAFYPTVNGVKTNQPEDGYSFIWMDGTTIKYWP